MYPYIILLFVIIILLLVVPFYKPTKALIFVVLALFSGFRYEVGIDYNSYIDTFNYIISGYSVTNEPLFAPFILTIHKLGFTTQFFFFAAAVLTQYFVYQSIKHLSTEFVLSTMIYLCVVSFYLFTFNVVRQWIGVAVFMYSLKFIISRDLIKYTIFNLSAALFFHISLLFFLPLYFLLNKEYSRKVKLVMLAGSVFCSLSLNVILSKTFYSNYITNDHYSFESKIDYKIYLFFIVSILIEFFRKKIEKTPLSLVLLNCNFIGLLILTILLFQSSPTLILTIKRFHNYFLATYIFLIPLIFDQFFNAKLKSTALLLSSIILSVMFILTIYFNGATLKIIPYQLNFNIFR